MLNLYVKLSQCLNPVGHYPFWYFEGFQPFETVMVHPEDHLVTDQVMSEMLQS